jgi:protein-L-isoaspartate(D-aspartate) O-methyltransferase
MAAIPCFSALAVFAAASLACAPRPDREAPGAAAADFAAVRARMVREQLAAPGRDIVHPGVLRAMAEVPRHEFVPASERAHAYEDRPLPIGWEQTISQPYIVAFMCAALDPKPQDRVLEVGTGSGYHAAVMSRLVAAVYTIEIVAPLAQHAESTLVRLGYSNVHVRAGDGYRGWPEAAPFDAILVTCAPESVPQPLVDQLAAGGRMIVPVGEAGGRQELVVLVKRDDHIERRAVLPVRFVPMTGEAARRR